MIGKTVALLVCFLGVFAQQDLPDYLKKYVCHKSDPNFDDCLLKSMQETKAYFVKGIKELNIPPLDPISVPYFTTNRTVEDIANLHLVFKNVLVTGAKDAIIKRIKTDPERLRGEMSMLIPKLHVSLDYDIKGTVMGNRINAQGHMEGDFVDVAAATKGSLKKYIRDGVEYFEVDQFDMKVAIGDGKIKLTSATPDQQVTADFVAQMFNNNPRGIMETMGPMAIAESKDIVKGYMNELLATIPASAYLPDRK